MKLEKINNMWIFENPWFPFKGFSFMNICGLLVTRDASQLTDKTINHELIHTQQMKELFYIGFYIWYITEWAYQGVVRLFNKNMLPYYFITLEQEAYENDDNLNYLNTRVKYAFIDYIGKWIKY